MNNCHSSTLKKFNLDSVFCPWWDENNPIIRRSLMVWITPLRRWKSSPGMNSMGYEYGQISRWFQPLNSSILRGNFHKFLGGVFISKIPKKLTGLSLLIPRISPVTLLAPHFLYCSKIHVKSLVLCLNFADSADRFNTCKTVDKGNWAEKERHHIHIAWAVHRPLQRHF